MDIEQFLMNMYVMDLIREQRYVLCPSCGGAVEAKRAAAKKTQCSHCHSHFSYLDSEIRMGFVAYDGERRRWSSCPPDTAS